MTTIHLFRLYWKSKSIENIDFYVKGWAEYGGSMFDADQLLDLVVAKCNPVETNAFKDFLLNLNGNFSFIIRSHDVTFLCVDKMRCFPIIYFKYGNTKYITDDINALLQQNTSIKLTLCEQIVEQYLCSNYVFGPHTIYKDVYSVQSGELVEITDGQYVRHPYFQRIPNMDDDCQRDINEEASVLDTIFINVTRRMIISAPTVRKWIVPLSGGHDSRLIASYLYKLGVKNVICYTYGLKGPETILSEKVAKALGYEWHFIEYTPDLVAEVQQSNELETYKKYAFNGSSVPHLQDYITVYALKKRGIVKAGDIFVPGHAHEVLAGSHLMANVNRCDSIRSSLFFITWHISGFGYAPRSENLFNYVISIVEKYGIHPNQISEYFDWQERQTKFIVNSVRIYEYFGFGWRIPQWDNELIKYWDHIGFNYRYARKLYFIVEKHFLLVDELKNIPFISDLKPTKPFKVRLAASIPDRVKKILRLLGVNKSTYYLSNGIHLIYSDNQEAIRDYKNNNSIPPAVKKYLSYYPDNMKLKGFEINSVSTLLIIKNEYS